MKLELCDLSCGYDGAAILSHVNLALTDGEACCILGPNGVGKTTLFRSVLQLQKPLGGSVCIDGEDISAWSLGKRSRYLSYVAQAHMPAYPYKVIEIAMMGRMGLHSSVGQPSSGDYECALQALEDVGISHLQEKVYTEISGGERQLLMIARALAQRPRILIMDEPTANLDYGNMVRIMRCVSDLKKKGICVIFTSHMPDQAFMCDAKTLLLARGYPPRFGEAAAIITEQNLYEAYQTDIQVLEVIGTGGEPIKVVAPRFR